MFDLRALRRNRTVRYGLPMLLLVVGGSFGLREFTQIRYDAQKFKRKPGGRGEPEAAFSIFVPPSLVSRLVTVKEKLITASLQLDPSLEARVNVEKQAVILEEEYEKMKQLNLLEWKNIRGPRPWEDSREYQEQQRARMQKKE